MVGRDMISSLGVKAREVGDLLNAIVDDDEREQAQEYFEHALNNDLYSGSLHRGGHSLRVPEPGA
jgi:hypothetical protein